MPIERAIVIAILTAVAIGVLAFVLSVAGVF